MGDNPIQNTSFQPSGDFTDQTPVSKKSDTTRGKKNVTKKHTGRTQGLANKNKRYENKRKKALRARRVSRLTTPPDSQIPRNNKKLEKASTKPAAHQKTKARGQKQKPVAIQSRKASILSPSLSGQLKAKNPTNRAATPLKSKSVSQVPEQTPTLASQNSVTKTGEAPNYKQVIQRQFGLWKNTLDGLKNKEKQGAVSANSGNQQKAGEMPTSDSYGAKVRPQTVTKNEPSSISKNSAEEQYLTHQLFNGPYPTLSEDEEREIRLQAATEEDIKKAKNVVINAKVDQEMNKIFPKDLSIYGSQQENTDKASPLRELANQLKKSWFDTIGEKYQFNEEKIEGLLRDNLKFIWMRMTDGAFYKIGATVEALSLQPGGGHHQTPEIKEFIQKKSILSQNRNTGNFFDGTNAVDKNNPGGALHKSNYLYAAAEMAFKQGTPGVIRENHKDKNQIDVGLANAGDDHNITIENIKDVVGKDKGEILKDSKAFSNGIILFHGPSIAMEDRAEVMKKQLKPNESGGSGVFEQRLENYILGQLQKHPGYEELKAEAESLGIPNITYQLKKNPCYQNIKMGGDLNLTLFEKGDDGKRCLKDGVKPILDKYHLALVVPSGQVTWGRPVSDQLHKNATSKDLEPYDDSMMAMVPVTSSAHRELLFEHCNNEHTKLDLFLPATALNNDKTEGELIKEIPEPRKQFSTDIKDRMYTDHAEISIPPNTDIKNDRGVVFGNMADHDGVTTAQKSLVNEGAKEVWGNENIPPQQLYEKLAGISSEVNANFLNNLLKKQKSPVPPG